MNRKASESLPVQRLRHHVTGAIERGEAQVIAGIPATAPQTAQIATIPAGEGKDTTPQDSDLVASLTTDRTLRPYVVVYSRSRPQGAWKWGKRSLVSAVVFLSSDGSMPHLNSKLILAESYRCEYDGRSERQWQEARKRAESHARELAVRYYAENLNQESARVLP